MIREMIGENIYYTGNPDHLRQQLRRAFHETEVPADRARVVVVPNGAYSVCLPFVAQGLRMGLGSPVDVVVVLAPPSSPDVTETVLPESDEFATPFGTLPVDQAITGQLLTGPDRVITVDEIAHLQDHSIETVLPALHYLTDAVPIVPILVGETGTARLDQVHHQIRRVLGTRSFLVVAAANISGFVMPDEADARARKVIRLLMTSRGEEILERAQTLEKPPRSLGALILAHLLAGPRTRPEVLGRGTFETEFEGAVGSVIFASIAYLSA